VAREGSDTVTDPWVVLGVDATASYAEVHRAYLVRCQIVHPDRHQGASAEVLAEAQRATSELNEAWEAIRHQLQHPGGVVDWSSSGDDGVPADPSDCLDWVVQRLVDAGREHGDPLSSEEISRLRAPAATAPTGRRFERWMQRRRKTLRLAMSDGEGTRAGREGWAKVFRVLGDADVRVVLLLLFEQR
jgi:hypothetical protein